MHTLEAEHLLLLLRVALGNGEAPKRTEGIDLSAVYALACKQGVEHMISEALQADASCPDPLKQKMRERNLRWIRTLAIREHYKEQIHRAFEQANIRYIPLKGAIFASYYPTSSMRTSSDYDILYDGERVGLPELTEAMRLAGATKWEYGKEHSRFWFEGFLVELHPTLFATNETFYPYFSTVWERATAEPCCAYHMCVEDVYLYHLAHMVKHMLDGGIGIRFLVDLFLFCCAERVKRAYVDQVLEQLGMLRFAQNMECFAHVCFAEERVLTETEMRWLDYVLSGDMYGSDETRNALQGSGALTRQGRISLCYYVKRAFPPYRDMKWLFPVLKKAPILLPFCYVWRLVRMLLFGRKKAREELEKIRSVDTEKQEKMLTFYRELGIENHATIK